MAVNCFLISAVTDALNVFLFRFLLFGSSNELCSLIKYFLFNVVFIGHTFFDALQAPVTVPVQFVEYDVQPSPYTQPTEFLTGSSEWNDHGDDDVLPEG